MRYNATQFSVIDLIGIVTAIAIATAFIVWSSPIINSPRAWVSKFSAESMGLLLASSSIGLVALPTLWVCSGVFLGKKMSSKFHGIFVAWGILLAVISAILCLRLVRECVLQVL